MEAFVQRNLSVFPVPRTALSLPARAPDAPATARRPADTGKMMRIQTPGSAAPPQTQQNPQDPASTMADAPPKQVAAAMERLSRAARLIADIRIGADRLLELLFLSPESPQQSNKTIQFVLKEEDTMRQHFQNLRSLGYPISARPASSLFN
ncbi:Mediator of RNA polymerase II transcription subunit 27 [Platanthera guangdongensis]|uniref:Mediator of RNA polymerase II transcription subunit 27 n=1 Tax=Platanthera guangdongensis TaxID=2320717 RepID=A0ABR2ML87_9ASPA